MLAASVRLEVADELGREIPAEGDAAAAATGSDAAAVGLREVEHVFARQKGPIALVVRTVGLARATVKIGLDNLLYNMHRAVWLARVRAQAA